MPIDYKRYPDNWKELREKVLERAKNSCEHCGLDNHQVIMRNGNEVKIVLTIAHLDHDEENHDVSIDRLNALCQQCHLRYDVMEKKARKQHLDYQKKYSYKELLRMYLYVLSDKKELLDDYRYFSKKCSELKHEVIELQEQLLLSNNPEEVQNVTITK